MKEAKRIALGTLTALGVELLLLALATLPALRGTVPESAFPALTGALSCAASFAGAAAATFGTQGRKEPLALGTACAFWAATALLGWLCFGAAEPGRLLRAAAPILCGAAPACFLAGGSASGKRKRGKGRGAKSRR